MSALRRQAGRRCVCIVFAYSVANSSNPSEGIAVTEYGLLVALVAVLLIGVVTLFGSSIRSWFADKTSQITTV